MEYIYVLVPFVFAIMAISIPQILVKEDHPKLESRIVLVRRLGYGLIALVIVYGIMRYLI
jgi:uncharacterized membrane protein